MNLGRLQRLQSRRTEKLKELENGGDVRVHSDLVARGRVRIVLAEQPAVPAEPVPIIKAEPVSPVGLTDATTVADARIEAVTVTDAADTTEADATIESVARTEPGDPTAVDDGADSTWPGEAETLEAEAVEIELAPDDRLSDAEPDSDESAEIGAPLTARVSETRYGDVGDAPGPSSVTDVQLPQTEVGASDIRAPLPPDEAIVDIDREQASDEHVEEPDPLVLLRVLPFPDDRSVGQVWIRRETADDEWDLAGSARASVGVPADAGIRVAVAQEGAADLSWLQAFEPHDLCSLVLDGVTLTLDQLAHVIRLTGLRELSLRDTGIDDRMLRTFQSLSNLDSLSLSGARVTGLGMLYLKPLTRLRTLDVSSTAVSGDGLVHLATLPALESLCLAHTRIGDGAMVHLQRLTTLRQLDLQGTAVTATGRQRIPATVRVTPEAP